MVVYSEASPTELDRTSSQVKVYRMTAFITHFCVNHSIMQWTPTQMQVLLSTVELPSR